MKGGRVAVKDLAYALCYAAASFQDGHTSIRYYGAGNFSLRFSLKRTSGGAADSLSCNVDGVSYA